MDGAALAAMTLQRSTGRARGGWRWGGCGPAGVQQQQQRAAGGGEQGDLSGAAVLVLLGGRPGERAWSRLGHDICRFMAEGAQGAQGQGRGAGGRGG